MKKERRTRYDGVFWRGRSLWITYSKHGIRYKEPAKTRNVDEAVKLRASRLADERAVWFGLKREQARMTIGEFVPTWRTEVMEHNLAPAPAEAMGPRSSITSSLSGVIEPSRRSKPTGGHVEGATREDTTMGLHERKEPESIAPDACRKDKPDRDARALAARAFLLVAEGE